MRGILIIIGIFIIALGFNGCSNNTSTPSGAIITTDPFVESPSCCVDIYKVDISGLASASGDWFWLGLIQSDSLILAGTPALLAGQYENEELTIGIDYQDNLMSGVYQLTAFSTPSLSEYGDLTKTTKASDVELINYEQQDYVECYRCDTLEIIFRTFIECPIVGIWKSINDWVGYFSGDNRNFNYLGQGFRSSQVVKLAYSDIIDEWEIYSNHAFGVTTKWQDTSVTQLLNNPRCGYTLKDNPGNPACQTTAINGQNGNILNETMTPQVVRVVWTVWRLS